PWGNDRAQERTGSFSGRGGGVRRNHRRARGHFDGHGCCGRKHRRSEGRGSAATCPGPPPRKDVCPGGRVCERDRGPLPDTIARQATPPQLIAVLLCSPTCLARPGIVFRAEVAPRREFSE